MKHARCSEEQIIGVLKEAEAGAKTADLARRHGVSEATIYNCKAKIGGLEASEARRLPELESEKEMFLGPACDVCSTAMLVGRFRAGTGLRASES